MEALKMRVFLAIVAVLVAVSAVQNVAAADAPAPSPTSDATTFLPAVLASLVALAFGQLLF
ncbi:arabinogalactan protein 13-like [Populus alba x Populus x berolinensis]|nr:arabinogalactan protein 13-like [Populus alba x Populus x berolinensis]